MKAIVNASADWGIGSENRLLVTVKEDMKYFRKTTAGRIVIMGRKTLESFPDGKPLKGRFNIVLTGDTSRIPESSYKAADIYVDASRNFGLNLKVARMILKDYMKRPEPRPTFFIMTTRPEQVLKLCAGYDDDSYVIGGASIYRQFLPYCEGCLVTRNDHTGQCDAYFPDLDSLPEWELSESSEIHEDNGIKYSFNKYIRTDKDGSR